jgi:hypothetical protein
VHVLGRGRGVERETDGAVVRVERHDRPQSQALEGTQALARTEQRRRDVVVDRLGELGGELRRGGDRHQVELRDQHVLGHQLLRGPPDQRRLAVASRREHDDVLAVQDVGLELGELGLAVGERLVERQRAVAERIRTQICVTQVCVD